MPQVTLKDQIDRGIEKRAEEFLRECAKNEPELRTPTHHSLGFNVKILTEFAKKEVALERERVICIVNAESYFTPFHNVTLLSGASLKTKIRQGK